MNVNLCAKLLLTMQIFVCKLNNSVSSVAIEISYSGKVVHEALVTPHFQQSVEHDLPKVDYTKFMNYSIYRHFKCKMIFFLS